mmetsp:Transcript_10400/g.32883  ORF Transcript_10400/g.32883 Transcript_10400/m.32883 type:complete len:280 (+) Transcript_10400:1739-2578(+)
MAGGREALGVPTGTDGYTRHHEDGRAVAPGAARAFTLPRLLQLRHDQRPRPRLGVHHGAVPRDPALLLGARPRGAALCTVHSVQPLLQPWLVCAGGGAPGRHLHEVPAVPHPQRHVEVAGHRTLFRPLADRPGGRGADAAGRLREVRPQVPAARPEQLPTLVRVRGEDCGPHRDGGHGGVPQSSVVGAHTLGRRAAERARCHRQDAPPLHVADDRASGLESHGGAHPRGLFSPHHRDVPDWLYRSELLAGVNSEGGQRSPTGTGLPDLLRPCVPSELGQ